VLGHRLDREPPVTHGFDLTRVRVANTMTARKRPAKEGGSTVRLRDYWLDALATGVTAVMLAFVYSVLAGYAAGPAPSTPQASVAAPASQPGQLADSMPR
jgi:hypothetical protein